MVFSDLTKLAVAEPERAIAAGESARRDPPENSIAVSVVPTPAGFSAALFIRHADRPLPAGQLRKTSQVPSLPSAS